MADKVVEIPGVGVVSFPDGMSDDAVAQAAAQLHASKGEGLKPGPPGWPARYPKTAEVVKGALKTLPVIGATLGGLAGEGVMTIPGAALGAGVGKGAKDLIAHGIGLEETTPAEKAKGIANDVNATAAAGLLFASAPLLTAGARSALSKLGGVADRVDPDLVSIASPRAGAVLRKAQQVRDVMGKVPAAAPATSGEATAAAETPTATSIGSGLMAMKQANIKLTAEEVKQGLAWLKEGVKAEDVLARITAARAFNAKFGNILPTTKEVTKWVADRNATGKWD